EQVGGQKVRGVVGQVSFESAPALSEVEDETAVLLVHRSNHGMNLDAIAIVGGADEIIERYQAGRRQRRVRQDGETSKSNLRGQAGSGATFDGEHLPGGEAKLPVGHRDIAGPLTLSHQECAPLRVEAGDDGAQVYRRILAGLIAGELAELLQVGDHG